MSWPNSQDYNEAVQNPSSFSDGSLKAGSVSVNAIGLPVPRSGNFADVYQYKDGGGTLWAVKLFTRKVPGLQERYTKISEHIAKANFPFTVGFDYQPDGIRIKGQWYPLLKMEWVEGFTLNEFVRDNAGKPQYLHALMQMWAKLCARLRDANFAHADLQHGNVLLVPATTGGKLGLKLIDYDGMWVPSLAETHSGEVGHPNFQHPLRLKDRLYNAEVDRFPHLVIAAALRATLIGGKALWDRFDNGDNLLFKEADLRDPAQSGTFKALWELNDDVLCTLVGKMALATREPLRKTPWLDDVLLGEEGERLSDEDEKKVMAMLGVGPHFTASKEMKVPAALNAPELSEFDDFEVVDDDEPTPVRSKPRRKKQTTRIAKKPKPKNLLPYYIGGGVAAVLLLSLVIGLSGGGKKAPPPPTDVAAETGKKGPAYVPPAEPKKIVPPVEPVGKLPPEIAKRDPVPVDGMSARMSEIWHSNRSASNADSLLVTNDGRTVFTGNGTKGKIRRFDVQTGKDEGELPLEAGEIISMIMLPGDVIVIKSKVDGVDRLICWDDKAKAVRFNVPGDCRLPQSWPARDKNLYEVLLPSGQLVDLSLTDGSLTNERQVGVAGVIHAMSVSRDGKYLGILTADKQIASRELAGNKWIQHKIDSAIDTRTARLAINSEIIALGVKDVIRLCDRESGKLLRILEGHEAVNGGISGLGFAKNERMLVSASFDRTLRVWDIETGKQLSKFDLAGRAKAFAMLPDGTGAVVACNLPEQLQMWQFTEGGGTTEPPVVIVKKDVPAPPVAENPGSFTKLWSQPSSRGAKLYKGGDGSKIFEVNSNVLRAFNSSDGEPAGKWTMGEGWLNFVHDGTKNRITFAQAVNQKLIRQCWDLTKQAKLFDFDLGLNFPAPYSFAYHGDMAYVPCKPHGVAEFSWTENRAGTTTSIPFFEYPPNALAISTDGEALLAWSPIAKTMAFRPARTKEFVQIELSETKQGMGPTFAISPDKKLFICYGSKKTSTCMQRLPANEWLQFRARRSVTALPSLPLTASM